MEFLRSKINVFSTAFMISAIFVLYVYLKRKRQAKQILCRKAIDAFDYLEIDIVTTVEECDDIIARIRRLCKEHQAVGFDCEWVSFKSGRRPISMLQLSTYNGYCVLFRLHLMKSVPNSLRDLLMDSSIYKVGVGPIEDAKHLSSDYDTPMQSVLDLRHLANFCGKPAAGLGQLSQSFLNVILNKNWKTRCGDWEAKYLEYSQVHYAASDAHAAIRIFVKMMETLNQGNLRKLWGATDSTESIWNSLNSMCGKYADLHFKASWKEPGNPKKNLKINNTKPKSPNKKPEKDDKGGYVPRKKPLYENCYLQAPDGELLCSCDSKKAMWYVERDLGELVSAAPTTVRLRFEPAGRSVGVVGDFYRQVKENQCVVCGVDSYIRKNVVPREYRKYFPEIMKEHASHDVVLLCVRCHRQSNTSERALRDRLAAECRAPFAPPVRPVSDRVHRRVRMAARALLINGHGNTIPEHRCRELQATVKSHYEVEELTPELLQKAATAPTTLNCDLETHEPHSAKVVAYYVREHPEGLLALERVWRNHFLDVMRPAHMPEYWAVNHSEDRLIIKYREGRLGEEDLKAIGLKKITW